MSEHTFYCWEEIQKNNGKIIDKFWIVYRDSVYDVTSFMDNHPGGRDLIEEWAGKDATKSFDDVGHSDDAEKILKKHKIGELALEERKTKTKGKVGNSAGASGTTNKRSFLNVVSCGLCG